MVWRYSTRWSNRRKPATSLKFQAHDCDSDFIKAA
jgi:hypothetical protein